ncbi:MAG: hypothetical protein ABIZ18_02670 [Caldimonas sp.]
MKLFGIELRKPSFNEFTSATVMGVGLWVAAIGCAYASGHALDAGEAGALLMMCVWGCVGTRLGLDMGRSGRHVVAHIGVSALLLGLYQGALALVA